MRMRSNQSKKDYRTTVILSEEHHAQMVDLANRGDVSVAWLIRQAIGKFLESHRAATTTAGTDMVLHLINSKND